MARPAPGGPTPRCAHTAPGVSYRHTLGGLHFQRAALRPSSRGALRRESTAVLSLGRVGAPCQALADTCLLIL